VLDGFVARRTKITTLGKILDPAADKLMVVSAYIILPFFDHIPAWVSVVVVSRDVIISLGFLIIYLNWGSTQIMVRPLGKWTTFVQCVGIGLFILSQVVTPLSVFAHYFLYLVAAVTAASGLDYILYGVRQANILTAQNHTKS
jgi:cardiolipin synthase (CMP-forming)